MSKKVLILCTGNSARSQMAEALINDRLDGWEAVSAGTQPAPRPNPYAIRALHEIGIQTEGSTPQHVDAYKGVVFDQVITVCDDAAENCPVWLGEGQRKHISFPDPAAAEGTDDDILAVFRQVRDDIAEQVLSYLREQA